MNTGRRTANPAAKKLAGTYRPDRHGDIAPLAIVPSTAPVPPAYMPPAARAVWDEEVRRVTACGTAEADSSLFARYCVIESLYRQTVAAGELPKAAILTELRRMAELLGIAGLRSRLAKGAGAGEPANASPFTVRKP